MVNDMFPQLAGDMVVLLHLIFILFVVLGGLLVLRYPRISWLHLPAAIWGAMVELQGWICPLTPLEHYFRQTGDRNYNSDFINHYILPLIYPPGLTRQGQLILGLLVITINAGLYGYLIYQQKKNRTCH